jgi:hypothetical protein
LNDVAVFAVSLLWGGCVGVGKGLEGRERREAFLEGCLFLPVSEIRRWCLYCKLETPAASGCLAAPLLDGGPRQLL